MKSLGAASLSTLGTAALETVDRAGSAERRGALGQGGETGSSERHLTPTRQHTTAPSSAGAARRPQPRCGTPHVHSTEKLT